MCHLLLENLFFIFLQNMKGNSISFWEFRDVMDLKNSGGLHVCFVCILNLFYCNIKNITVWKLIIFVMEPELLISSIHLHLVYPCRVSDDLVPNNSQSLKNRYFEDIFILRIIMLGLELVIYRFPLLFFNWISEETRQNDQEIKLLKKKFWPEVRMSI